MFRQRLGLKGHTNRHAPTHTHTHRRAQVELSWMKSASEKLIKCGCDCWCDAAVPGSLVGHCCHSGRSLWFWMPLQGERRRSFLWCLCTRTQTHTLDWNLGYRSKFRKVCCICLISWRVPLKKLEELIAKMCHRFSIELTVINLHTWTTIKLPT